MNWLPIETAPENGDDVLVTDGTQVCVGTRKLFFHKTGRYEVFRDENVIPGHTWSIIPTHWMPLPALPGQEQNEDEKVVATGGKLSKTGGKPTIDYPA